MEALSTTMQRWVMQSSHQFNAPAEQEVEVVLLHRRPRNLVWKAGSHYTTALNHWRQGLHAREGW